MATVLFVDQDEAIRNLFSQNTAREYDGVGLLVQLLITYTMGLLSYGTMVPGGLFVPCILAGASMGRLVGMYAKS